MLGKKLNRRAKRGVAALLTGALVAAWGWALMELNLGQGLRSISYDLPFLFQQNPPPEEVVLVYLDEFSHQELQQPLTQPLDRRYHARMIDRLRQAGAQQVVFDILFYDSYPEPDAVFAEAMRAHGNVVLAGEIVRSEVTGGVNESLLLATPDLRRAAAGWGLTDIPIDTDGVIRSVQHSIETPFGIRPSLSARAYQGYVRSDSREPQPISQRLLDYYGPRGTLTGYSYSAVLDPERLPDTVFEDKVVLVGARQQAGLADAGKDTFPTPHTLLTRELMPGVEIQGTLLANLIQHKQLEAVTARSNLVLIIASALLFALLGCLLTPIRGLPLSLAAALLVAVVGIWMHRQQGTIYLWTIPSFGQLPLAVISSLIAHYVIEYAARWKLRQAFKSYMSDEQARQIDEDEVSLELGGKEVEATILFSDLAGFTSMSEGLPPQSVSKALIAYFESATAGILDNHGTIIKYVGDAVMATWGAPLAVDREADRAIDAAIQMQLASRQPISLETEEGIREQVLETRIGINSGTGLAGNLGSKRRFDYSVIGDTTNTAARLEGLNKMLGTSILVSQAALSKCSAPERYVTREMGCYVLKGKRTGIVVHEVLGHQGEAGGLIRQRSESYLSNYQQGLAAFRQGDWVAAQAKLNRALGAHDRLEQDPAAQLILTTMQRFDHTPPNSENWHGEIVLDSK